MQHLCKSGRGAVFCAFYPKLPKRVSVKSMISSIFTKLYTCIQFVLDFAISVLYNMNHKAAAR